MALPVKINGRPAYYNYHEILLECPRTHNGEEYAKARAELIEYDRINNCAPGSIAYSADHVLKWCKNAQGEWVESN